MTLDEAACLVKSTCLASADLIRSQYRDPTRPLRGLCYVASEALYHLRAKEIGYKPCVMKVDGETHWFLRSASGDIVDVTAEQFDFELDYSSGRGIGFLTQQPSQRALKLMERILTN